MKCDCQLHSCYCSSVNVNPVETSTTMPRRTRKRERCWEIQFLESVKDHRICASCWAGQLEKYLSKHSSKISIQFFCLDVWYYTCIYREIWRICFGTTFRLPYIYHALQARLSTAPFNQHWLPMWPWWPGTQCAMWGSEKIIQIIVRSPCYDLFIAPRALWFPN